MCSVAPPPGLGASRGGARSGRSCVHSLRKGTGHVCGMNAGATGSACWTMKLRTRSLSRSCSPGPASTAGGLGVGGTTSPLLRGPAACAGSLATLCSSFALCPQSAVTRCLAVTGLGNPTRCLCCPPSLHPHIADDQDSIGVLPCEQLGWAFTASLTKTKASLSPPTPTCQQSPSPHVTCWVLCAPDGWEGAPVLAETPPAPPSVTGSVTRHTSTADGTAGPTGPWVMAKPRHQNPAEAG